MPLNFINLQAQYRAYKEEIDEEIKYVLDSSCYIMGEKIEEFEFVMSNFLDVNHAIGCSSGTDALLLALMALDIGRDDEVITTPFTFIATAEVIRLLGAKPIFVDINEETFNIDAEKITQVITSKTKAIVPVSLFGQCSDMSRINEIAGEHNLPVIEDAAQSFGAEYNGKKSGTLSTIGVTSFFPAKPLGCYGDGGALFTNDASIAESVRTVLNHGQTARYVHSKLGINARLDAIQAAVLLVKLRHYPDEINKRNEIADRYLANLKNCKLPKLSPNNTSVWAQFCLRVANREQVISELNSRGLPTAVHYPIPLHLQPVFGSLGYKKGDFPISEMVSSDIMALPFSAFLTKNEQDFIISSFNEITS